MTDPRTFRCVRIQDDTGVSGVGHVADGVVFGDGTTVLRWRTAPCSTAIYGSYNDMVQLHGHHGNTQFLFPDGGRP